jgi:hypothetical protein
MARTRRGIPYKHYWGETKKEMQIQIEEDEARFGKNYWGERFIEMRRRDLLLHGTESRNHCIPSHEYFNRANRVGRRVARDQLRPHIVLDEDFDFDDSAYLVKYKGVWWEIY